jgi:acetyl esterase/lipase
VTYNFDPELAEVVPLLPTIGAMDDPILARKGIETLMATLNVEVDTSALEIEDLAIPGTEQAPDVGIRLYKPKNRAARVPGLVYLHGGGFVVGNLETEHIGAVRIATELSVVVVSVDYRLAPEDPFPAGLEDCYAALRWIHDRAEDLGVDRERIGVIGGSAGGGLAAGLALLTRDRGGPALCFQFLGIPELDDRLETPSMRQFTDTPLWNRPSAEYSWRWYLGDQDGDVSPYAAPARATDLAGLPPAYVSTMEFDPLRDEGIIYAMRLLEAGVPVELHQYPGTFHGSSLVTTAAVSRRQGAEMIDVLRRGLRV